MMNSILVSSSEELNEALRTVTGGETIRLAAGTYDRVVVWSGNSDVNFSAPVTFTSDDPNNRAVISELRVNGASNIIFDDLIFDYEASYGAPTYLRPFEINNSSNITISNSTFLGDLAKGVDAASDGFGTGTGLSVRKSENVTVENNSFTQFKSAISFGGGTGYVARGNDISELRVDGITVTKSQDVLIEDNYIHDFVRSMNAGDHSDMIQFWTTNNDTATSDVTIRNNRLDIGQGGPTQGIFMGNEAVAIQGGGADMFYQNVLIEGNLILGSHSNGIVLGATNGLVIQDNILLHSEGNGEKEASHLTMPTIRVDKISTNVLIEENAVYRVTEAPEAMADSGSWIVQDNILVQDMWQDRDGFYSHYTDLLSPTWEASEVEASQIEASLVEETAPLPIPGADDLLWGNVISFDAGTLDGMRAARTSKEIDADIVKLGKLDQYLDTDKLSVAMSVTRDSLTDSGQILNNHMRLSVGVHGDDLKIMVATETEGFKSYLIRDLDFELGREHDIVVSVDRITDHLQILFDQKVVLDDTTTDFGVRDGMHNWGWVLGNQWHEEFDGKVTDIQISDDAHFVEPVQEMADAGLFY